MAVLHGMGWITKKKYGCLQGGIDRRDTDMDGLYACIVKKTLMTSPVRNFDRFDEESKLTFCAAALAIFGTDFLKITADTGIIGANHSGSLRSNLSYFSDYYRHGRKLARGNLFIYTLPTSPLAETAIFFGLKGPLMHIMFDAAQTTNLLLVAGNMIDRGEARAMLVVSSDPTGTVCFSLAGETVLSPAPGHKLDIFLEKARRKTYIDEIVEDHIA